MCLIVFWSAENVHNVNTQLIDESVANFLKLNRISGTEQQL